MINELAALISIYLTFSFLLPTLLFPNQLFKTKIKRTEKLRKFASRFTENNKEKTLRNVYDFVEKSYSSERYDLFLMLWKHFYTDTEKLVEKKQFLPCHVQNLVLVTLLVNAGFQENDLQRVQTITKFGTAHQHLIASVNGKRFKIDPFFSIFKKLD